jgi:sugar phosphate isomerase/epimerase
MAVQATHPDEFVERGAFGRALGIDQPAGCWPTTPRLKSYEAAGFSHVQVQLGPASLLADAGLCRAHAGALRETLRFTGLRLIVHAPHELAAGESAPDALLAEAVRYTALAGGELLVYHALRVPAGRGGGGARRPFEPRRALAAEELSLRRIASLAAACRVQLAIENEAPAFPGRELVGHNPGAIAELVRALHSPAAGMCLDLGHAHIVAGIAGCPLAELIEPVLDTVCLFHAHDNFGACAGAQRAGSIEPLRLDLHLPPGAGSLPWGALAPLLARHRAPLALEIHPAGRPAPATLAVLAREVLRLDGAAAGLPAPRA